jgi:uncharacterized protein YbaP (TraB family)
MFLNMKRHAAAAALIGALAAPAALAEAPAATPVAPAAEAGSPAIWTIEKPNGSTIAMFGSVHLLPQGQTWRTPALTEAFTKADVVVLETPIAEMESPELMAYLQQNMMNPPGTTLSTLLTAEEKKTVETAGAAVGLPFAMLEPMRPWMAALQMTVAFAMKQGFDPNAGVDKLIEAEAKAAGKGFAYFETAKEQLEIFTTLPSDKEVAFLVLGARDIVAHPDELNRLVAAWAKGDVAGIDEIMNRGLQDMPDLAKLILEDRNARWVTKISDSFMTDDKDYLIVVGAGHLAGDKSVQAMLRAKGVTVTGP